MEFRVALVDDHALVRGAIAQVLAATPELPGLQVVQESSLGKLRARLDAGLDGTLDRELAVDLVMLELGLPDLGGLLGFAAFRSAFPTIPVIVMFESGDARLIERCAVLGAAGIVQKSGSARQIRDAVRAVLEGNGWHPAELFDGTPRGRASIGSG